MLHMSDLLIPNFIDLQRKRKLTSLSWEDGETGPKHEVVWTSACKCKGIIRDELRMVRLTVDLEQWTALKWVQDPPQPNAVPGLLLL